MSIDRLVARSPSDGQARWLMGHFIQVKLDGKESGGALSIIELIVPPRDPGPPPHTHRREDEIFYVLEGCIVAQAGDRQLQGEAGSLLLLPKDVQHSFRNPSDSPTRLLVIMTPAGFEQFFLELGEAGARDKAPMPAGPPAVAAISAATAGYGLEIALPR